MAGLEGVVRPIIFPDIRPRPRPALPPEDDPTKGFAVISGNPAGSASSSLSWSLTTSRSRPREIERRVDETRVYQVEDDGTVNRDNFVDIEIANKITMEEPVPGADESGESKYTTKPYFYERVKEKDNIEIMRKNVVLKADAQ